METNKKIREELRRKYNYFIQCYETVPRTLEADLHCVGGVVLHITMPPDLIDSLCALTEIESISNITFNE